MLCKCNYIVLYTVHVTAFSLRAISFRTRKEMANGILIIIIIKRKRINQFVNEMECNASTASALRS